MFVIPHYPQKIKRHGSGRSVKSNRAHAGSNHDALIGLVSNIGIGNFGNIMPFGVYVPVHYKHFVSVNAPVIIIVVSVYYSGAFPVNLFGKVVPYFSLIAAYAVHFDIIKHIAEH